MTHYEYLISGSDGIEKWCIILTSFAADGPWKNVELSESWSGRWHSLDIYTVAEKPHFQDAEWPGYKRKHRHADREAFSWIKCQENRSIITVYTFL